MGAAVKILSAGEAQRLTQGIKSAATVVRDGLFRLRNLVDEAKSSNVWAVLGFASWTAYLADTLASEPMRLGREQRMELVEYLSGEGLSVPAIAIASGAAERTVQRDMRVIEREQVVTNVTPSPAPRAVVGLDGKTYTAQPPQLTVPVAADPEQLNAEQYSLEFGRALVTLLRFENDGYGAMLRAQWERGKVACPDGYVAVANPDGFRRLAAALTHLADEWTD